MPEFYTAPGLGLNPFFKNGNTNIDPYRIQKNGYPELVFNVLNQLISSLHFFI